MSGPILAIDQGTTNTKALLVDDEGRIVRRASRSVQLSYPRAGWVEQDPLALWQSVRDAADDCIGGAGGVLPSGVAISNQRESVAVWERATGRPAGPVVIWQCRRTSERCDRLRLDGAEATVRDRTGLPIDPLFSATKLAWLLDEIPDGRRRAEDGELCVGTIDSWSLALSFPAQTCTPGGPPKPARALTASRLDASTVHVDWDAAGCPAPNYHLLYGPLATVGSYALAGGVCGLGPLGSYDWQGVPAGDLWYVVVSDDAGATEGS